MLPIFTTGLSTARNVTGERSHDIAQEDSFCRWTRMCCWASAARSGCTIHEVWSSFDGIRPDSRAGTITFSLRRRGEKPVRRHVNRDGEPNRDGGRKASREEKRSGRSVPPDLWPPSCFISRRQAESLRRAGLHVLLQLRVLGVGPLVRY